MKAKCLKCGLVMENVETHSYNECPCCGQKHMLSWNKLFFSEEDEE